jgi:DNA processing protein
LDDTKYWVGFNLVTGIGPMGFARLLAYFKSIAAAWEGHANELKRAGIDDRAAQQFSLIRSRVELDVELERLKRAHVHVLTWESPAYPRRLREIHASPPVLYVKGSLVAEDEWAVAVVGTRKATAYGREATTDLVGELARNGITIVSGLARGIDSIAHRAALDAGGRTIAVLGCGLDTVYPSENSRLAQQIAERGALVSEYPLGTKPEGRNFPPRNRILSGLSLGVLVV